MQNSEPDSKPGSAPDTNIVIGIDPGTAITGYGVLDRSQGKYLQVLEYGVIRTEAGEPLEKRLALLYDKLSALLQQHRPAVVGCEQVFFSTNVKTAISVAQARGVILLAIQQSGAQLVEMTPSEVKLAVTGHGSAEKKQIQYMTQQVLKLDTPAQPDDAADALAIAVAVSHK